MSDQLALCVRSACASRVLHVFLTVAALVCSGVPVSNRVSTKIQQLLNTLKRPKRPPLSEFFVDDSEEIVEGEGPH